MERKRITSGSRFEGEIGFSRAVRLGDRIEVSGTAPIGADGTAAAPGDVHAQTLRCLEIIRDAIEEAGGAITDVIRTRVFLTDIETWQDAARAHGEVFSEIRPASTFVAVSGLIDPAWGVEIEAEAQIGEERIRG